VELEKTVSRMHDRRAEAGVRCVCVCIRIKWDNRQMDKEDNQHKCSECWRDE